MADWGGVSSSHSIDKFGRNSVASFSFIGRTAFVTAY